MPLGQDGKSLFLVTFWLPRDANGCPFHACRCISTKVTAYTDSDRSVSFEERDASPLELLQDATCFYNGVV